MLTGSTIIGNIKRLLFTSNISMYEVSKATGIPQTTLSRYVRKESDIENMSLKNALKLNDYYLKKYKGENNE